MELEPRDFLNIFLKFWAFEPHFLRNFFLIKNVYFHGDVMKEDGQLSMDLLVVVNYET